MNRNFLTRSLVVTILATGLSFNVHANNADTDAIVGAIVGGLIGNQIGGGNGKKLATGLGIIIGAVVGKDIGKDIDENDRRALEEAQRSCFQQPIGRQTDWDGNTYGSRTGSHGNFRTTREGYVRSDRNQVCREYQSTIVTRQKTETKTGIACTKGNGSWTEVNSSDVVFRNGEEVRTETVTAGNNNQDGYNSRRDNRDNRGYHGSNPGNQNQGGYVVPTPPPPTSYGSYASLRGYCSDQDHQEFYAAKAFAYSTSGLNLTTDQSVQWALDYTRSHRCGSINEYSARFRALYSLAYSTSGLNMSSNDAAAYASKRVETVTEQQVQQIREVSTAVKNFVYSTNGLNRDSSTAARVAMAWVDRGYCGNASEVEMIRQQYSKEYSFAYSTSGLNMSSNGARDYALDRISRNTRCADLLR